jgi:hypothetical protein
MVSLLNEARLAAGRSRMGWINPFLYMAAEQVERLLRGSIIR